jgi:hypothetical protein
MKTLALALTLAIASLASPVESTLDQRFTNTVRPFLATHCLSCHSGPQPAAQLDFQRYPNLASVIKEHPRWALVAERLKAGDMPPQPFNLIGLSPPLGVTLLPSNKRLLYKLTPAGASADSVDVLHYHRRKGVIAGAALDRDTTASLCVRRLFKECQTRPT